MAERPREYPRPDATLPPFADMANAGMEAVLRRLDSSSGEGRDIALRQVAELQACVDARCEATGLRDPLSEAVSGKLEKFLAASAGDEFDVTPDMIRAATPAPMPSAVSGGSRLETVVSANLPERRAALADIAADPAVYALLPEHLREDRAIALAAVEGNAENFDKVPVELAKDTGFRSEAMRANPLVARRWSYYEHAGAREVNLVFSQAERTPSLLAGIRPEIIVQFLVQRSAQVRAEHFSVLPDWHLSVVIKKLLELDPAKTSFGPPESPVLLSKVVEDMRPQVLFDIKRGA